MRQEVKPKKENYTKKQLETLDKLDKMDKQYNKPTLTPEKISKRRFIIILSILLFLLVITCTILILLTVLKNEEVVEILTSLNVNIQKINPLNH